jgi:hypothetical protein
MRKTALLIFATLLILFISCKKKDSGDDTVVTPFSYGGLVASDTIVTVNSVIHITATATGDDLQYTWASADQHGSNYGNIIGSGADIQWSVCHSDVFVVTCTVADKHNNSGTKNVRINCKP